MRIVLGGLVLLAFGIGVQGCGGDCDPTNIDGVYLMSFKEASGTCGPVPDSLVQFNKGTSTQSSDCTVIYNRYSDDMCKNESSIKCTDVGNGIITEGVQIAEGNDDGSNITGSLSMTIRDMADQSVLCTGMYDLTFIRQ